GQQDENEHCQVPGCNNPGPFSTDESNNKHYCSSHIRDCDDCKEDHYVGDMHIDPEDKSLAYCESCYQDLFRDCPNCHKTVNKDEILLPTRRNVYEMKRGGCTECSAKCNSCKRVVE